MQKNENQNRWAPIVVRITEPYPGLYLYPWALRGESYTIFFSAQERRREVKSRNVCRDVQMLISFLDTRNKGNGSYMSMPLNCGCLFLQMSIIILCNFIMAIKMNCTVLSIYYLQVIINIS